MPSENDRQRLGTDLLTIATDLRGADSVIVRHIRERLHSLALPPATAPAQLHSA
jgi:hypothetical protein